MKLSPEDYNLEPLTDDDLQQLNQAIALKPGHSHLEFVSSFCGQCPVLKEKDDNSAIASIKVPLRIKNLKD